MNKFSILIAVLVVSAFVLVACGSPAAPAPEPAPPEPAEPEPAEPEPEPEPEPTEPPTAEPVETEPPATEEPAAMQHQDMPGDVLPEYTGTHLYDHHINTTHGSIEGDRFYHSRLERPYNTDDNHFAHLDMTDVWFYDSDPMWVYVAIGFVGADADGNYSGNYAVELDTDLEGDGEYLVLVQGGTTSAEWTAAGVTAWKDGNGDVGGLDPIYPDGESGIRDGDGYEVQITDDPDIAFVRLSTEHPNAIEIAFKKSMTEEFKYMIGAWAGGDMVAPGMFDLNDHFTHEEAGALNPEYTDFYPIKAVTMVDNTCRMGLGFFPADTVKGLCP